jgi:hypothetical protein
VLKQQGFFGVNRGRSIPAADQLEIAEQFTGKGGLKSIERFADAQRPRRSRWHGASRSPACRPAVAFNAPLGYIAMLARRNRRSPMERKLLQAAVAVAGFAGVALGLTGVLFGTMHADLSGDVVMDAYVRFGKGVLLAIGLIYWSCIPQIEQHGDRISLITLILLSGTLSRLISVTSHGVPTLGILLNLVAGLILVPLLWLWHRHIALKTRRGALT